jgi:hypothetical protein
LLAVIVLDGGRSILSKHERLIDVVLPNGGKRILIENEIRIADSIKGERRGGSKRCLGLRMGGVRDD